MNRARQKIPVGLRALEKPRARPLRRWARLGAGDGDEVRYRGDRGWRKEEYLRFTFVALMHEAAASAVTRVHEEAGTLWPTGGAEHIHKVSAKDRKLMRADPAIAQDGSVPDP